MALVKFVPLVLPMAQVAEAHFTHRCVQKFYLTTFGVYLLGNTVLQVSRWKSVTT